MATDAWARPPIRSANRPRRQSVRLATVEASEQGEGAERGLPASEAPSQSPRSHAVFARYKLAGSAMASSSRSGWWIAQAAILGAAAYTFRPLARCLDRCFVDLQTLGSHRLVELHVSDMRLNAWILGWVQRALLDPALSLFDANTFYPARNALAGSEHMVGVALQMLPLRWFSADAVALHQGALALSALVLAWTSFALVRWATGSAWAAAIAAMAAMFAPWRLTELPHLQLLSVQWIPLVWLLVTRIALGEAGSRAAALLALVLGIQLLSSYYLAYFTTLSIAVLLALLFLQRRVALSSAVRLMAAAVVPYAALAWLSLPYLARDSAAELTSEYGFLASSTIAGVWAAIAPVLRISPGAHPGLVEYALPASVFVLAVTSLAALAERPPRVAAGASGSRVVDAEIDGEGSRLRRVKTLVLTLFAIVLVACVMSIGQRIFLAGEHWMMPGSWFSAVVPGFSVLRVPHRWLILVGVAAPILAGLGAWTFDRWLRGRGPRPRTIAVALGRVVVALALLWTLPWRPLPVRAAIPGLQRVLPAYESLALLPPGPAVEIPWPMTVVDSVVRESRYTLASTLHWHPILNGFTAYVPPSYTLLHRVAQELPQARAIRRLSSLTGLRYIVVHINRLTSGEVRRWRSAAADGSLQLVREDPYTHIYRVADWGGAGRWTAALASSEPRALTLTGLSREALEESRASGSFDVALPDEMMAFTNARSWLPLRVAIENRSDRDWPGLDVQREGLVELRYRFSHSSSEGTRVALTTVPLDIDMPAGKRSLALVFLKPPSKPGEYLLEVELVQRVGDTLALLPLGVASGPVRVVR